MVYPRVDHVVPGLPLERLLVTPAATKQPKQEYGICWFSNHQSRKYNDFIKITNSTKSPSFELRPYYPCASRTSPNIWGKTHSELVWDKVYSSKRATLTANLSSSSSLHIFRSRQESPAQNPEGQHGRQAQALLVSWLKHKHQ